MKYLDLLALMPQGSFYRASGTVLPVRSGVTTLVLRVQQTSAVFDVYDNDVYIGAFTSLGDGTLEVQAQLAQGPHVVTAVYRRPPLSRAFIGDGNPSYPSYIECRQSASILWAHGEALDALAAQIQAIRDTLALETADDTLIEAVYGRQVAAPRPSVWSLGAYRLLLQAWKQAARSFATTVTGFRQLITGIAAVTPWILPMAWRASWTLGCTLLDSPNMAPPSRVFGDLPTLNVVDDTWVLAASAASGPNTFVAPYGQPVHVELTATLAVSLGSVQRVTIPDPRFGPSDVGRVLSINSSSGQNNGEFRVVRVLSPFTVEVDNANGVTDTANVILWRPLEAVVNFGAGWNGGTIIFTGVDQNGRTTTEAVAYTASPAAQRRLTTTRWRSFDIIQKTAIGGAATVSIGLNTFFVDLVSLSSQGASGVNLTYSLFGLSYGGNLLQTTSPNRYTLTAAPLSTRFFGLVNATSFTTSASWYLPLRFNDQTVLVDLSNNRYSGAGFNGGASPRSLAQVVSSVNTYAQRTIGLGAVAASGTITCPTGAAINVFALGTVTVQISDGVNAPLIFELNTGSPAAAGRVLVPYTAGDSAAQVATSLAAAINDGWNNTARTAAPASAGAIRVTAVANGAVVTVRNQYGGTQGNTSILLTINAQSAGFTTTNMTGGANSGLTPASASSGTFGNALLLEVPYTSDDNGINTYGVGADAQTAILGTPRLSGALTASGAVHQSTLLVSSGRLPVTTSRVWLGELQQSFTSTPVVWTLDDASTLDVFFPADWLAGGIRVVGTDVNGLALAEDFARPDPEVATGTGASNAGTSLQFATAQTDVRVGDFFYNVTTGSGAFVSYVFSPFLVELSSAVATVVGNTWELRRDRVVTGIRVFATTSAVQGLAPVAGAVRATVMVTGAEQQGFLVRVGRNSARALTLDLTTDTPSVGNSTGIVNVATSDVRMFDNYVSIAAATAASTANRGLHRVQGVGLSFPAVAYFLQHEDKVFYPETGVAMNVWSAGEVVRVIDHAGSGVARLYPTGLRGSWLSGAAVEVDERVNEAPRRPAELVVDVNPDYRPPGAGPFSDPVTTGPATLPDGWIVSSASAATFDSPGYLAPTRFQSTASGTAWYMQRDVDVSDYRTRPVRVAMWVSPHFATASYRLDVSFDGGAFAPMSAVAPLTNPIAITGTHLVAPGAGGALDPRQVLGQVLVPFDATTMTVRLLLTGGTFGVTSVEQILITVPNSGMYLGQGTAYLTGVTLYRWAAETLTQDEQTLIEEGLDRYSAAHTPVYNFQLTPVAGVFTAPDLLSCTLTNISVDPQVPNRLSIARPASPSRVTQTLVFGAPSNAILALPTRHTGPLEEAFPDELLTANTVPQPQTPTVVPGGVLPYRFLSATTLQVASTAAGDPANQAIFNPSATYVFAYDQLTQIETPVIDLGVSFASSVWLYDVPMWMRIQPNPSTYPVEVQLLVIGNRAVLTETADTTRPATLYVDNGQRRQEVLQGTWRFATSGFVEIDAPIPNAVYTLTYTAQVPTYERTVEWRLQVRSDTVSPITTAWRDVDQDAFANPAHRYHQMRLQLWGVERVLDVAVYGLGLRGFDPNNLPGA